MISDFWLKLIALGLLVAGITAIAWGAYAKFTESYREEGRAEMRPIIAQLEKQLEDMTLALERQTSAVKSFKAASERRMVAATKAKERAEKQAAALADRVIQLETAQPAFPDDLCRSACQLLEEFKL